MLIGLSAMHTYSDWLLPWCSRATTNRAMAVTRGDNPNSATHLSCAGVPGLPQPQLCHPSQLCKSAQAAHLWQLPWYSRPTPSRAAACTRGDSSSSG